MGCQCRPLAIHYNSSSRKHVSTATDDAVCVKYLFARTASIEKFCSFTFQNAIGSSSAAEVPRLKYLFTSSRAAWSADCKNTLCFWTSLIFWLQLRHHLQLQSTVAQASIESESETEASLCFNHLIMLLCYNNNRIKNCKNRGDRGEMGHNMIYTRHVEIFWLSSAVM